MTSSYEWLSGDKIIRSRHLISQCHQEKLDLVLISVTVNGIKVDYNKWVESRKARSL